MTATETFYLIKLFDSRLLAVPEANTSCQKKDLEVNKKFILAQEIGTSSFSPTVKYYKLPSMID